MEHLEKNMFMDNTRLELKSVYKNFGSVIALKNISMTTDSGQIKCILGDNGAGKSTLVNIISGVFKPTKGECKINDKTVSFLNPLDAMNAGISTVYQSLAIIPILSIYRNFFLGQEPIKKNIFKTLDKDFATKTTIQELKNFDINIEDPKRMAGTLSGGERQILAIARALYFGAKILILDEPTSALGVKESNKVVEQINNLKKQNINVILVSHNIDQAFMLGDKFFIIKNGNLVAQFKKSETSAKNLRTTLEK